MRGDTLRYVDERIKTKEIVLEAVKQNGKVFLCLDEIYQGDPEIVLEACKNWDIQFVEVHKKGMNQTYATICEELLSLCQAGRDVFLEYVEQNHLKLSYQDFIHVEMIIEMGDELYDLFFYGRYNDMSDEEECGADNVTGENDYDTDEDDDVIDTIVIAKVKDGLLFFHLE